MKKIEEKASSKPGKVLVDEVAEFTGNPGSYNPGSFNQPSAPISDKDYLGPVRRNDAPVIEGVFSTKDFERPEMQRAIQDGVVFMDPSFHNVQHDMMPGWKMPAPRSSFEIKPEETSYSQRNAEGGWDRFNYGDEEYVRRRSAMENLLKKYK